MPEAESHTKLFVLNLGVAEQLQVKECFTEILYRGQILSLNVDEGGKATEIIGHGYMPDAIGELAVLDQIRML